MSRDVFGRVDPRKPTNKPRAIVAPPNVDVLTTGSPVMTPDELAQARANETAIRAAEMVERNRRQPVAVSAELADLESSGTPELAALTGMSPQDLRDPAEIAAENERARTSNAAYSQQRYDEMTPQERRVQALGREMRDQPGFATLMRGLDVPTVGLAAELGAVGLALSDDDYDYRTAQQALERATEESSLENPNAARLGTALGLIAGLGTGGLARSGVTGLEALAPAAQMAGVGGTLGGVGGYLGAEPGHEWEGAAEGFTLGAGTGLVGGGMVGAGRALGAAPNLLTRTAGAAIEGGGYGLLSTPGTMREPITELNTIQGVNQLAENMVGGARFGAGLSILPNAFALNRQRAADAARASRAAETPGTIAPVRTSDFIPDEVFLTPEQEQAAIPSVVTEPGRQPFQFGPSSEDIIARQTEATRRVPIMQRMLSQATRYDPIQGRAMSAGVVNQPDLNRLAGRFGGGREGLSRAVDALQEAGLVRPGNLRGVAENRDLAAMIAEQSGQDLQRLHGDIAGAGGVIPGADVAARLEAAADDLTRGIPRPDQIERANYLRQRARDFRFGTDPTEGVEQAIDYGRIRGMRSDLAEQMDRARSRPGGPTPTEQAMLEEYNALGNVEREEALRVLGDEAFSEMMRRNRTWRATEAVGRSRYGQTPAGGLLNRLGGMTLNIPGGQILGNIQQRVVSDLQHAVLSTLNELGGATPRQAMTSAARLLTESGAQFDDVTRAALVRAASRGDAAALQTIRAAADQAIAQGGDAALNAQRALSIAESANEWPVALRLFQRISQTDPERAARWAALAEAAAARGGLGVFLRASEGPSERARGEVMSDLNAEAAATHPPREAGPSLTDEERASVFGGDSSDLTDEDRLNIFGQ